MQVGDMVKHKWGTLAGRGLIIEIVRSGPPGFPRVCHLMWNCHGNVTLQKIETQYFEVISESR